MRIVRHSDYNDFTKTCKKHWVTEDIYSYDARDYNTFFEIWDGRKFIGALFGDEYSINEMYIDRIFVIVKYRNKGYGKYFVNQIKDIYKHIYVESTPEAFIFWKKCGFIKRRDQSHRIYSNTIDMYITNRKKR